MAWDEEEDTTTYKVVVDGRQQYALWPAGRENPLGWRDAGKMGSKREMVAYIERRWPGMEPLRLLR
jgi:MbtH protein